ncbi:MAG TPA: sigma-70 family RNA polymerase sigma factor [Gemmataceae bacterium]|nr:sigma-70 family RNA polymerase sigma factor [Gemmataceae bacterium]
MDRAPPTTYPSSLVPVLYHFCRLQLPEVALPPAAFERHLQRSFALYRAKRERAGESVSWENFLDNLHAVDWFLCCACLEGSPRAWDALFAARASRTDCLLVDALRARAVRLFPRDEERQDSAVADFWGYLLAGERPGAVPILARYDGQRPLVPWLIRVFQNKHISELRQARGLQQLPEDDDLTVPDLLPADADQGRWHEEFRLAAREWLGGLGESDLLLLGLRLRYRLSQRQVASVLGIHEGNVSRQIARLRDHCLEQIGRRLAEAGWTGDDLSEFVRKEMESLLLDEPRLAADRLAALLAARGKARRHGDKETSR